MRPPLSNAGVFIDFCKRLMHGPSKPVFLIVDEHPTHKAKKVTQWIEQQEGRMHMQPDLCPF